MFTEIAQGRCGDPFSFLGIHPHGDDSWIVRAFLPHATAVEIRSGRRSVTMEPAGDMGGWTGVIPPTRGANERSAEPPSYWLVVTWGDGTEHKQEDPYRFPPQLDESRLKAFLEGTERRAHQFFGAHAAKSGRASGTHFSVWAPHARAVNVMGDMNGWDGRHHPMRPRGASGCWELFIPDVEPGTRYKYQIVTVSGDVVEKSDPFARAAELRPATASVVPEKALFRWHDRKWQKDRPKTQAPEAPMSVYEVHAGSWKHGSAQGGFMTYREMAEQLLPYVKDVGFTHIQLMPLTEHPLDESWGYQPVGFFCPTSRFGPAADLRYFVDTAHEMGLGVILDWVPGHFPRDRHGLGRFDGTALYEHFDDRQASHPDWGTLVFDYGKGPVQSFLISSALYWLEDFHVDGLRVDAVASMLYLDYSRKHGEWTPNREGGNTNLEAVEFLQRMNDAVHDSVPGALTIAEESTAWPRVTGPTEEGGLGFDQKWNMGWMNDTLSVMQRDPVYRQHHYDQLTFSIHYAFSERYVLPLSHDEVVHGKGSLLSKMPGTDEMKFAGLRLLLAYQWMHPGKKLLFMGGEIAQWREWTVVDSLDWALEDFHQHVGVRDLIRDMNGMYVDMPSLHAQDHASEGFEWLNARDAEQTTLSFMRWAPGWEHPVIVALNFTPVCRENFRIPVPFEGHYKLVLNTDADRYGGWGTIVPRKVRSKSDPLMGRDHQIRTRLPGLSALVFVHQG